MQRTNAPPTFTDLTVSDLGGPRATAFFDRCLAEVPFEQLAASVADIFVDDHPKGGAPHWPVVTMLKVIFLQKCFALGDPMAEEMLRDRISFRRFVGLSFDDKTPDHSTISTFRKRLRERGHGGTLFDQTLDILRAKGLVVSQGTLIDAAIVEAPLGGKREDGSSTADRCAPAKPSRADAAISATALTSPPIAAASSPITCTTPPPKASTRTSTSWRATKPRRSSPTAGAAVRIACSACASVA